MSWFRTLVYPNLGQGMVSRGILQQGTGRLATSLSVLLSYRVFLDQQVHIHTTFILTPRIKGTSRSPARCHIRTDQGNDPFLATLRETG
jgi:hypothetical protein